MRNRALAVALAAAAVAGLGAHPAPSPAAARCQEDAPCWNWATMGNHQRAVYIINDDEAIVSPCRFQRLWRRHLITYRYTRPLKGDALALRLDCRGLAVQAY